VDEENEGRMKLMNDIQALDCILNKIRSNESDRFIEQVKARYTKRSR